MRSWVFWFCFDVSINQMLYKKANNMSSWQDSKLLNISFCEWDSTEGEGGPWWERGFTFYACYHLTRCWFPVRDESVHSSSTYNALLVFWFTSYIWVWWTWKRTKTYVFRRTRVGSFGPRQSSNELSHHQTNRTIWRNAPGFDLGVKAP